MIWPFPLDWRGRLLTTVDGPYTQGWNVRKVGLRKVGYAGDQSSEIPQDRPNRLAQQLEVNLEARMTFGSTRASRRAIS